VLHAARCKYRTQNDAKNRHLRIIPQLCRAVSSQLRHVLTIGKVLNSNMSSTCPHNIANFGPLTAEICWPVWGTPANFNGIASYLRYCIDIAHRRPARCLAVSWAATLYIHFRRLLIAPDIISSGAKFILRPSRAFTARHSSSGRQPNFAAWYKKGTELTNFRRGHHLYSAGRPSRWASAHILVYLFCSPNLSGRTLDVYHTSTHGVAL